MRFYPTSKLIEIESLDDMRFINTDDHFNTLLMISHEWISKENSDPDGFKMKELKSFLRANAYSHIWIDAGCLPMKDTNRNRFYYNEALKQSLLYYACYDTFYLGYNPMETKRAWCRLEALADGMLEPINCRTISFMSTKEIVNQMDEMGIFCNSDPEDLHRIYHICSTTLPNEIRKLIVVSIFLTFVPMVIMIKYSNICDYILILIASIVMVWMMMNLLAIFISDSDYSYRKLSNKIMYFPMWRLILFRRNYLEYEFNKSQSPNRCILTYHMICNFSLLFMFILIWLLYKSNIINFITSLVLACCLLVPMFYGICDNIRNEYWDQLEI